ncbi:MAG TPA: hypothetical protein PLV93_10875, partial [Microthrixaceae bacterium]|nr:hypothetical protein [Microthrixaceae bacterium]
MGIARLGGLIAAALSFLMVLSSPSWAAPTLPTTTFASGYQVTPTAALTYYGSMSNATTTPASADVTRLAQALGKEPDRIFRFVHDDIEMVWLFGVKAGSRGAIIDKAGTPFDQTQLLVELMRASGCTATYKLGVVKFTLAEMLAWTGLSNQTALEKLLKDGGFPYEVVVEGGVTKVKLLHLWAEVVVPSGKSIAAGTYAFDPAYKGITYTNVSGSTIDTASGFNSSTFVSNAASGSTSSTSGAPQVRDLNRTNVTSALATAASTMQSNIATNHPADDIEAVVGGSDIQPLSSSYSYPSNLSYVVSTDQSFTGDIPVKLRTKVTVSFNYNGGTQSWTHDWYADEIYGEQLFFEPKPGKEVYTDPDQFRFVEGDHDWTGWLTGVIPGPTVTVDHPY